jgi:hypothetical protein
MKERNFWCLPLGVQTPDPRVTAIPTSVYIRYSWITTHEDLERISVEEMWPVKRSILYLQVGTKEKHEEHRSVSEPS